MFHIILPKNVKSKKMLKIKAVQKLQSKAMTPSRMIAIKTHLIIANLNNAKNLIKTKKKQPPTQGRYC
jgi:hypothetical protein